MPTREQIIQLGEAIPAMLDCLAGLAQTNAEAAELFERAQSRIAASVDPIAQAETLIALPRSLGAAGVELVSEWTAAAGLAALLPRASASPAITRAQSLARAASAMLQGACWQEAAIAAVASPPRIRDDVLAARAVLVSGPSQAMDLIADLCGWTVYEAVRTCLDTAIEGLDEAAFKVAPLAQITLERRVPSLVASWLMYDDPARAEELVERAGIATPLMMPKTFLAASPTAF